MTGLPASFVSSTSRRICSDANTPPPGEFTRSTDARTFAADGAGLLLAADDLALGDDDGHALAQVERRGAIEHGQIILPADLAEGVALGVALAFRDQHFARLVLGRELVDEVRRERDARE